ncbi:hypothetical protein EYC84_002663 [Monilinia fructicola]|nr:hypothetical protein EYC84_002663 [Monilinia fructicola]
MGMYGPMTREKKDWFPTRLLCKRFNVQPPKHVQPSADEERGIGREAPPDLVGRREIDRMMIEAGNANGIREPEIKKEDVDDDVHLGNVIIKDEERETQIVVDAERNEALEGQKAGEAVFKAIFGDDDSDEDY